MLPEHDVYVTDWRDARLVPLAFGSFDLDDFIDYVIDFIRFIGPDTHIIAVCQPSVPVLAAVAAMAAEDDPLQPASMRSEEHTSEPQSLMRISYAAFCLKNKKHKQRSYLTATLRLQPSH